MGNNNSINPLSTDWHQMTVKELLEAANNTGAAQAFEQKIMALSFVKEFHNKEFDDFTMEEIIHLIEWEKQKEGKQFSAVSNAGEALVCLADNFVKVNEQVLYGYMPTNISNGLRSFYYVIYHWFLTITNDQTKREEIIDLIFNRKNRTDAYMAAKYFPIVNIISGLLVTLEVYDVNNNNNPKKVQEAIEDLYRIIVEDMFHFTS